MKIELKNIKHSEFASQETNRYQTLERFLKLSNRKKSEIILKYAVDVDKADRVKVSQNIRLFDAFIIEAHIIANLGYENYSARSIIHYLRHHTNKRDTGFLFKINDHVSPKLSRVSMALFPALNGLFETRGK